MSSPPDGPRVTQTFALPVVIQVEAGGPVTVDQVRKHVGAQLDAVLNQDLADRIDRDPDDPMPFAFRGTAVYWDAADDIGGPEDSTMVAVRLSADEVHSLRALLRGARRGPYEDEVEVLLRKFGFDRRPGQ
jgi:hypothetical protein